MQIGVTDAKDIAISEVDATRQTAQKIIKTLQTKVKKECSNDPYCHLCNMGDHGSGSGGCKVFTEALMDARNKTHLHIKSHHLEN